MLHEKSRPGGRLEVETERGHIPPHESREDQTLSVKQQAEIFGLMVAAVFVGLLGWGLSTIKDEWPLWLFLALCISGTACCLLLAWMLDKRSSGQSKRGQSDQP